MGFFKFLKGETKREKVYNGVFVQELKPEYKVVEEYFVQEPFAKVYIVTSPELGVGHHYFVEEVKLNEEEQEAHRRLAAILSKELQAPESLEVDAASYVLSEAKRIALKYKRSLKKFNEESLGKVFYYVVRDLAGYGDLNTILMDPNIEDVSCNGLHKPIYIWHRKYESIPTNLSFTDELIYDSFILKLAHLSGKHISSAHPMLDAMLPEKHRLACTFMREVSTLGSTFCVRKFRPDPFSVIDLIKLGTLDAKLAAYLWLLLENKMNLMIIGGTGAGKTSMLNALTSLLSPNDKIITVEEVAELNTPHENWVQLVSRKGFRFGSSDTTSISLFDLGMNERVSRLRENVKFVRRGHMEVIATILSLCRNGPIQKTPIMYRCNLSFRQLQKYLDFLIRTGFLEVKNVNGKDFYQTTEKGRNFLKEFENIKNLLNIN